MSKVLPGCLVVLLWHVSSRSGDGRLACKLLYHYLLLLFLLLTSEMFDAGIQTSTEQRAERDWVARGRHRRRHQKYVEPSIIDFLAYWNVTISFNFKLDVRKSLPLRLIVYCHGDMKAVASSSRIWFYSVAHGTVAYQLSLVK